MRWMVVSLLVLPACAPATAPTTGASPEATAPAVDWDTSGVLTQSIPCDTPVVIKAGDSRTGIRKEYSFLAEHYPGYQRGGQALANHKGRPVDILDFTDGQGVRRSVCFDISSFFGKW